MSAAPSSEPSHTVASMKRILAAISSVTLALAVGAMGPASPAHARDLSPYEAKLQGLGTLQSAAPSANEFSLSVAPQVGWDAGLESLRPPPAAMYRLWDMDVAWRDVNPQQGVFDWSILDRRIALVESWGGKPFLVLGLTPQWAARNPGAGDPRWGAGSASPPANIDYWKTYVRAVANRYGGRIAGYELWNEANLTTFWQGSPSELFAMAQSAYDIIKTSNPNAVVAAPSITTRSGDPQRALLPLSLARWRTVGLSRSTRGLFTPTRMEMRVAMSIRVKISRAWQRPSALMTSFLGRTPWWTHSARIRRPLALGSTTRRSTTG